MQYPAWLRRVLPSFLAVLIFGLVGVTPGRAAADPGVWIDKEINLPTTDAAYVPSRDTVLALIADYHPSLGNAMVELDPRAGAIQRQVFVGSHPSHIAVSSDGNIAYVGLAGANKITEVDLRTFKVVASVSLGADASGPLFVEKLAVQPGHSNVVVAALSDSSGDQPHHTGIWAFKDGQPLGTHAYVPREHHSIRRLVGEHARPSALAAVLADVVDVAAGVGGRRSCARLATRAGCAPST